MGKRHRFLEGSAEVLHSWKTGQLLSVMVINALRMGIDCHALRAVIHIDPPKDAIDFGQYIRQSTFPAQTA
jgi:superfamily II DNA helicase RecQ